MQKTGEDDDLFLVAERTSLREPETFRDVVTSCREAGRVVREAANHYKEIQVLCCLKIGPLLFVHDVLVTEYWKEKILTL